jgi:hypothetical protein
LIRRKEETNATRSLHNTAKMMEGNLCYCVWRN